MKRKPQPKKDEHGEVVFDMAIAVQHATGLICKNDSGQDVLLEGHDEVLVVAEDGVDSRSVKRIVDPRNGKVVGELIRQPNCKRFEGTVDGVESVGLFSGKYRMAIWPKAKVEGLGYKIREQLTLDDRLKYESDRLVKFQSNAA